MDNAIALQELSEDTFNKLEAFMQQKFSPDIINEVYDPINFYTFYKNCPGKFKFPFGHKELLVKAANYCKNVELENIQHRTSLNVMTQQKEEKFVDPNAKEKLFREIGDQMISAFNDAKRCTLSAWSYPSRMVANVMGAKFKETGVPQLCEAK